MEEFVISIPDNYYSKLENDNAHAIILVNNNKAQRYQQGNRLVVLNVETKNSFEIVIKNMLYFDNITDAVNLVGTKYLGYSKNASATKIEDTLLARYKAQDVDKYGVVVVEYDKN